MNKVIVVLPIHKSNPTAYELISFTQCFRILFKHPICILAPYGLDLSAYKERVNTFDIKYIPTHWQSSIEMYNKLKKSLFFYKLFKDYEYILTYELDAFVFKDELATWCDKGYDYIGAPWFDKLGAADMNSKILGVGNSGFSLRNIHAIHRYIQQYVHKSKRYYSYNAFIKLVGMSEYFLGHIKRIFGINDTVEKFCNEPEDMTICFKLKNKFPSLHIADVEEARRFAFEFNPRLLYQLNNNELPFGCHAWWRYDLDFWKPTIESFGYSL
jgi:hypothetical protein